MNRLLSWPAALLALQLQLHPPANADANTEDATAAAKPASCVAATSTASNTVGAINGSRVNGTVSITTRVESRQIAIAATVNGATALAFAQSNAQNQIAVATGARARASNRDHRSLASAAHCSPAVAPARKR